MKKSIVVGACIALCTVLGVVLNQQINLLSNNSSEGLEELIPVKNPTIISKETTQKDRSEHFFRMLRDPEINRIPNSIQAMEMAFLEDMKADQDYKLKGFNDPFDWKEVGPNDVGGRTRAIAFDSRNSNIILAGGVSGGIWKSTNGGASWSKKTDINGHLGVTALVQSPQTPDVWYYSTGEFFGSAGADGASFFGSGIFKSTDNGETWSQVQNTADTDVSFNSQYDFISSMAISPTTGSIFFSSNALGIFRTTDDFTTVPRILGETNEHIWSHVAVNSQGDVIVVLSQAFSGIPQTQDPGVYISTNDGNPLLISPLALFRIILIEV